LRNYTQYVPIHAFIHGLQRITLFRDEADKLQMLSIIISVFKTSDALSSFEYAQTIDPGIPRPPSLHGYAINNTHYHLFFCLKFPGRVLPDLGLVDKETKTIIRRINYAYGKYYRNHYGLTGTIFKKTKNYYKCAFNDEDFKMLFTYVHTNPVHHYIHKVSEDDLFNSYSLYLAQCLANREIQALVSIKRTNSIPIFYDMINTIDFKYPLSIFSKSMPKSFRFMLQRQYNRTQLFNNSCDDRLIELEILQLYKNSTSLIFEMKSRHNINKFIRSIIETAPFHESINDCVVEFVSLFGKEESFCSPQTSPSTPVHQAITLIRERYPETLDAFMRELTKVFKVRAISKALGVSREFVRALIPKSLP